MINGLDDCSLPHNDGDLGTLLDNTLGWVVVVATRLAGHIPDVSIHYTRPFRAITAAQPEDAAQA